MRTVAFLLCGICACHGEAQTKTVTLPSASASATPQPVVATPTASASASQTGPIIITINTPMHFHSGASGRAGDVTFKLQMLPKLIVSGPNPEIEQLQIEATRGADHSVLQVDTRNKRATWGGVTFELGYADVYHDDIELTVHRP